MRKNVVPSTGKADVRNTEGRIKPIEFASFGRGTIQDPPASEVSDGLADSKNLTIFKGYYEGRTGSKLYTSVKFPPIEGAVGLSCVRTTDTIQLTSGLWFKKSYIGNYFCWGDTYELITDYIDYHHIKTEGTGPKSGVDCSIMAMPTAFFFHSSLKVWILILGQEAYYADPDITAWNKILCISRDKPYSAISDHDEYLEKALIFNSNGLFKIDMSGYPIMYKTNIDPPNIRPDSVPKFTGAVSRYYYLYSAQRLQREGGIVNRQTPSVIELETGTCVADENNIDCAEVYKSEVIGTVKGHLLKTLHVPVVRNTNPVEYERHLTHFPVWRTLNCEALDITDATRTKYNDPNVFVWVDDVRMAAAFIISIDGNIVTAESGEFEIGDTYSVLQLEDGQRYEIVEFVDNKTAKISRDYYYSHLTVSSVAAAIGNGRVIRGSVTGDILTRTVGDLFHSKDAGKTIFTSEGYKLYIVDYINSNHVRVHITGDLPEQGFTIDATYRYFYDTITDEILQARYDFYTCYSRYREALPNLNIGKVIPGFVVGALRGQKKVYYSGIENGYDFLIGQYVDIQVSEEVHDAISLMWVFQNVLSFICETSTWAAQLGVSDFTTLPGSGESIPLLAAIKPVTKNIGCLDPGSVQNIEGDMIQLITNEPGGEALRQFDGTSYSANDLLVDSSIGGRIVRALMKTKKLSVSIYDGLMGYILWRKNA